MMKALRTLKIPLLILTYFLLYFPVIIIGILSVNKSQRAHVFTGFSGQWYAEILQNDALLTAILNTLLVAVLATLISTVLGTLIAVGINALGGRARRRLLFLNNVPIVNPDIVTGISLMIVFSVVQMRFGFPTMLTAHVFFSIPFVVLSVLPKLRTLDRDLYNAAIDLGCTPLQAVLKVIIPAIRSGIVTGGLIAFTMSIDDFVISYFTTGNGFSNFSIWLYSRLGRKTFSPAAYAYNTLITLVTLAILVAMNIKPRKVEEK